VCLKCPINPNANPKPAYSHYHVTIPSRAGRQALTDDWWLRKDLGIWLKEHKRNTRTLEESVSEPRFELSTSRIRAQSDAAMLTPSVRRLNTVRWDVRLIARSSAVFGILFLWALLKLNSIECVGLEVPTVHKSKKILSDDGVGSLNELQRGSCLWTLSC
jgi:hypothetical protein